MSKLLSKTKDERAIVFWILQNETLETVLQKHGFLSVRVELARLKILIAVPV